MTSAVAPKTATKTQRRRPSTLLRWLFRLPIALYYVGLAGQLGRSTLLLTTRGRRSGRQRTTALNYLAQDAVVYVVSGRGTRSDWLLNLQADPRVKCKWAGDASRVGLNLLPSRPNTGMS
jgi:hypothetical protein